MARTSGVSFSESAVASAYADGTSTPVRRRLNHLRALEAESIHILREAAAEFVRPVMLYSIGKDSSVMLRLAQKAFFPARFRSRYCILTPATNFPR
jgi:sulfate adenylyltransferase subunit 2